MSFYALSYSSGALAWAVPRKLVVSLGFAHRCHPETFVAFSWEYPLRDYSGTSKRMDSVLRFKNFGGAQTLKSSLWFEEFGHCFSSFTAKNVSQVLFEAERTCTLHANEKTQ